MSSRIAQFGEDDGENAMRDRDEMISMFEKCLSMPDEVVADEARKRQPEVSAQENVRERGGEAMLAKAPAASASSTPVAARKGTRALKDDASQSGLQGSPSSLLGYGKLGLSLLGIYSLICLLQFILRALE